MDDEKNFDTNTDNIKQDKFQRLWTIIAYLAFLTALSYSPLPERLIELFAQYGLYAAGGYGILKTVKK